MEFSEYQKAAKSTAIYPGSGSGNWDALSYAALGLTGEAGEIANKLKKIHRDNGGVLSMEKAVDMAAELGDVLWYVAALATELGVDLGDIARANREKLDSRKRRGVIGGSGDAR